MAKRDIEPKGLGSVKDPALFTAFIEYRLGKGLSPASVAAELEEKGVEPARARKLVDNVHQRLLAEAAAGRVGPAAVAGALGGGLFAAGIAAAAWKLLSLLLMDEAAYAALGAGALVAAGVYFAGMLKKGAPLMAAGALSYCVAAIAGVFLTSRAIEPCRGLEPEGFLQADPVCLLDVLPEVAAEYGIWLAAGLVLCLFLLKRR